MSKLEDVAQEEHDPLLPENERMAILLHDNLCRYNHIDMCSWQYEINEVGHNWTRGVHKEYLRKANKLIQSGINIDTMKTVFECLYGSK